ncbi:MAG TPA: hypothetical protein PKL99_06565 [Syntrophales bacterium]|nr:hypothetical protein [Syntrophales bacterium]
MKFAIPVWGEFLSTVCDFCDTWVIVEPHAREPYRCEYMDFKSVGFIGRIEILKSKDVTVLLCGAISKALEHWVRAAGIEVIPYLRGKTEDIVDAYLQDRLYEARYFLPGCRRHALNARPKRRSSAHGVSRKGKEKSR